MPIKSCLCCFLFILFVAAERLTAESYQEVRPLQSMLEVPDVRKANVLLLLRSISGRPIYKLQCHSAGYTGDPDFDYSGDFECRLSDSQHPSAYSTLLTEDDNQSRDWESRGRFFGTNLRSPCSHILDFGARRSFELRGMKLTLQIVDPRFSENGNLRALKLMVSVRSDPGALRPIAKAVHLPSDSPSSCRLSEYFANERNDIPGK